MDRQYLKPDMEVIVRYGTETACPVCCRATVLDLHADDGMVWLNVYVAPGATPIPQMFFPDEIVGVPSLELAQATETRPEGRDGEADHGVVDGRSGDREDAEEHQRGK